MAFACLNCCKSFKRSVEFGGDIPEELPCPECGEAAVNLGRHFKAPRRSDARQWAKVRFLVEHGFRFQKIRTGPSHRDTVPYPNTLEEAKGFVIKYQRHAFSQKRSI